MNLQSKDEAAVTGVTPHRVLVVDDEAPLAQLVAQYLKKDGFDTAVAEDGPSAVRQARDWRPDVIILDLGLPGLDGIEVCRRLRTFTDCYVLMLTARSDEVDKLVGLSVGADDYLTKPFSPRELVARVRVLLRRPRAAEAGEGGAALVFGALDIDIGGRETHLDGASISVTRTEFDILAALAAQPKIVFTRRQLIDTVWGDNWVGDEHLVDVHIGHLRRKLGDDADDPRLTRSSLLDLPAHRAGRLRRTRGRLARPHNPARPAPSLSRQRDQIRLTKPKPDRSKLQP